MVVFLILWCCARFRSTRSKLTIVKVLGVENPAGMGTKHLAQKEMHECLKRSSCRIIGGRSRLAFRVAERT